VDRGDGLHLGDHFGDCGFTQLRVSVAALNVIPSALVIVLTIRCGLLAMIASLVASDITVHFPVTTDFSTWDTSSPVGLCSSACSGRVRLLLGAGRALFQGRFLDEA
jgi:hypothetical protein